MQSKHENYETNPKQTESARSWKTNESFKWTKTAQNLQGENRFRGIHPVYGTPFPSGQLKLMWYGDHNADYIALRYIITFVALIRYLTDINFSGLWSSFLLFLCEKM